MYDRAVTRDSDQLSVFSALSVAHSLRANISGKHATIRPCHGSVEVGPTPYHSLARWS
jgi:hypothetical protein